MCICQRFFSKRFLAFPFICLIKTRLFRFYSWDQRLFTTKVYGLRRRFFPAHVSEKFVYNARGYNSFIHSGYFYSAP